MAEVDAELIEKVVRWCAEAGRQAVAAEIRGALAPLSWDELLAVRALLADPPPARPLGPQALADLARGAPADVAAERERAGRYRREDLPEGPPGAPSSPPASPPPARATGRPRGRGKAKPIVVIRRARDRVPVEVAVPPGLPNVDELRHPEGRAELERLLRRHGARRGAILAELAGRFRRAGGDAPGEPELDALLDHHGLSRAFERRERDELLHALRAAGGVRAAAAARLGLDASGLESALVRLGAAADAERIREERRAEIRGRATIAERVRLLLVDEARLRDLGLLDEVEQDLRARLPEHVRALRAGGERLRPALAASLSITPSAAGGLALRFALDLGPGSEGGARGAGVASPGARPRAGGGPRAPGRGAVRPERSGGVRAGARDRAAAGPRVARSEERRPAPGERRPAAARDARAGVRSPGEKRPGPARGSARRSSPPGGAAAPGPRSRPRPAGARPAGSRPGPTRPGRDKPGRGPPRR